MMTSHWHQTLWTPQHHYYHQDPENQHPVFVEHETSAETLEMCQVDYIKTDDLMQLIQNNPHACLNAAKQLSRDYHTAYVQICALGLSDSVTDKLAKLFLSWSGNGTGGDGRVQLKNFFTHEEIAEMMKRSR